MRKEFRNRRAARLIVALAALGMFAGATAATASAASVQPQSDCMKVPGGWLC